MSEELQMMIPQNKFMLITENQEAGRIEVHLRGEFPDSVDVGREMIGLYNLAEQYSQLVVYINSVGGHLSLCVELLSLFKKFDKVITVGAGIVASAGFLVWCAGDVRVVQSHTSFMAHRETWGSIGKTQTMLDYAEHNDKIYTKMAYEVCQDILTEEEYQRSKTTEVWLTPDELIDERNVAIWWDDFLTLDRGEHIMTHSIIETPKGMYLVDGDKCLPVLEMKVMDDEPICIHELMYDPETLTASSDDVPHQENEESQYENNEPET